MTLQDQMIADAQTVFLNQDHFAEDIVSTPAGGAPTTIQGVVDRGRLDRRQTDGGRVLSFPIVVHVALADVPGLVLNSHTFTLPERVGGANKTYRVSHLIAQDVAMATYGLSNLT